MATKSVTLSGGVKNTISLPVSPNLLLSQLLQQYCTKFNLDHKEYKLFHKNKPLDLSLVWRLAGISANATIDVKKVNSSQVSGMFSKLDCVFF